MRLPDSQPPYQASEVLKTSEVWPREKQGGKRASQTIGCYTPHHMKHRKSLEEKYPPSEPCSCKVCLGFCSRPGWWTVKGADAALRAGYGKRMMLEMSPDRSFGVLSPAFKGCEVNFALQQFATRGCTFLKDDLCELHGTGFEPLECSFCHHERSGLGPKCHADLEKDWDTPAGRALIVRWSKLTGLWPRLHLPVSNTT